MRLLRKHSSAGSKKALLLLACMISGVGILSAQSGRTMLSGEPAVRYDTIRRSVPHSGVFTYPSRTFTPVWGGRSVSTTTPALVPTPRPVPIVTTPTTTYPSYPESRVRAARPERPTPSSFAIKTNLLYWATLTPNLGFEIGLSPNLTLDLSGGYNPWDDNKTTGEEGAEIEVEDQKRLVHWVIKPELRYWLKDRFKGHFFGVHAFYTDYDVGGYDIPQLFEKEFYYDGNAFGGGITYGYHWRWSDRWAMEFNIGVGVAAMDYTKKECANCGLDVGQFKKTYFGPTNAGIKLIFMIK